MKGPGACCCFVVVVVYRERDVNTRSCWSIGSGSLASRAVCILQWQHRGPLGLIGRRLMVEVIIDPVLDFRGVCCLVLFVSFN